MLAVAVQNAGSYANYTPTSGPNLAPYMINPALTVPSTWITYNDGQGCHVPGAITFSHHPFTAPLPWIARYAMLNGSLESSRLTRPSAPAPHPVR